MREGKAHSVSLLPAPVPVPESVSWVQSLIRDAGFDLAGIARAGPIRHPQAFQGFLARGWQGQMYWLERHLASRLDSSQLFEGAKSAMVAGINYWQPEINLPLPEPPRTIGNQYGRIARYAWSRDYHVTLKKKLHQVADALKKRWPEGKMQVCVDSAPIHERDLAAVAGLGWIGKHTLLIHPRLGSWLLLGVILTDWELPPDEPMADHCGTCTACLQACPTGALDVSRPYTLDASRCISYTTIELRAKGREQGAGGMGQKTLSITSDAAALSSVPLPPAPRPMLPPVPPEIAAQTGDWLFGCDVCQEVCPFNRKPTPAADPDLAVRVKATRLPLQDVLHWSESDRQTHFAGTAVKRAGLEQLKRNVQVCLDAGQA